MYCIQFDFSNVNFVMQFKPLLIYMIIMKFEHKSI